MPKEEKDNSKRLCVDSLRHNEYYGMQSIFDDLYAKSKNGEVFTDLMSIVLKRENILLAYRNIKTNTGSDTAGTDGLTIRNIEKLSTDEVVDKVRFIITGSKHGYRPKPVRRVEIPKPNGDMRPLGIPCIWDRLVQQCIKQVLEPICEAKFSEHSYGFRPNRSVEQAIAEFERRNWKGLHYVIEFDIKGFFDNVNHAKLLHQMHALGIQDEILKSKVKRILKTPIKLPNGNMIHPEKGTPQGGIISPLLANIVLNELDHWVESNWEENPVVYKYSIRINKNGSKDKGNAYAAMRKTKLKEMFIVRYADDFRVFCRTKTDAAKTKEAITNWLKIRLKLEVSPEKTRIVNVKKKYAEFLGFKIKMQTKGQKQVVKSHISDKQLNRKKQALVEQAKRIAQPRPSIGEIGEVQLYNSMVMGMQNYYQIATEISLDASMLNRAVMTTLTNRLNKEGCSRLICTGRKLTDVERKRYGKSKQLRYVAGTNEPIYPIGYVKHIPPSSKKRSICCYTAEGRAEIHDNLRINTKLLLELMRCPQYDKSIEYTDNRISLFSAQWGRCAITGKEFETTNEIHCHHKIPRYKGGTDAYENLILVHVFIHRLIHATNSESIERYKKECNLNKQQMKQLNNLRVLVGNPEIA